MNIAILLLCWGIGGTERRYPNLLRYLKKNSKNNYTLIINRYLSSLLKENNHLHELEDIIYEIPVKKSLINTFTDSHKMIFNNTKFNIPGPNYIIYSLRNYLRSKKYSLKRFGWAKNFDIVHITGSYWDNLFPEEIPKVIEGQDSSLQYFNKPVIKKLLLDEKNFINLASDRIYKKLFEKHSGIKNDRVFINPCSFIDYSKTRIEKKEKIVVFLGRFIDLKNPILFLQAVNIISKYIKDVKFYMLGSGFLENKVKQFILEKGLEQFVEVGFKANPMEILSKSLVYLSLQTYDNYHSQALLEAMGCGCSIVASDVGETWRLVSDEVGFRVPFNSELVAEKVMWLLNNPTKACRMGEKARKKVMKEQTVEKYAEYIEKLYDIAYTNNNIVNPSKEILKTT